MSSTPASLEQPVTGVFVVLASVQVAVMVGIAIYLNFGGR